MTLSYCSFNHATSMSTHHLLTCWIRCAVAKNLSFPLRPWWTRWNWIPASRRWSRPSRRKGAEKRASCSTSSPELWPVPFLGRSRNAAPERRTSRSLPSGRLSWDALRIPSKASWEAIQCGREFHSSFVHDISRSIQNCHCKWVSLYPFVFSKLRYFLGAKNC